MSEAALRRRALFLRTGSFLLLILLWWAAAKLMHDPDVLPAPAAIARTIAKDIAAPGPEGHSALFHIGITLGRILASFLAAMLLGIGIGLGMGLNRIFERSLLTLIPLLLTMPTILMVFLAVMWFGFSEAGGLIAVIVVVTPYVAVNIYEGAKAMDPSLAEMAATFRAGRRLRMTKVYLPQLMPYIFSAFRYGFGMTWKIVALAETFGLKFGVGYMFFFWFEQFDMTQVLAWVMMFVVLMLILEHGVFAQLESRAFAWRVGPAR